jgi:hypothetical protein
MPELPLKPLTTAVYDRLTGEDGLGHGVGETVLYAGAKDVPATYVAITIPDAQRRVTMDTEGHTSTLVLRCHTESPNGDAKPLRAFDLADTVKGSLEAAPLDLGPDHALLHLPVPNLTPNGYSMDSGHRAMDVNLRYDLMTQRLS